MFRILVLASLLGALPSRDEPAAMASPPSGLHVLRFDESSVMLELETLDFELSLTKLPIGPFNRLSVAGYDLTQQAGRPQVPVMTTLLGVPPDARIELRIVTDDATTLPGRYRLSPAPRPAPLTDDLQPGKLVLEPDQAAYASDALYPSAPARIAGDAWLRDQRIVRIELYPFQYNPAQGVLVWNRRLRVEVGFARQEAREKGKKGKRGKGKKGTGGQRNKGIGEPGPNESQHRRVINSPFEGVLRRALINYDMARTWRGRPPQDTRRKTEDARRKTQHATRNTQYAIHTAQYPIPNTQTSTTPRFKITIDHDALYRLTYTDLEAAGIDVDTVDPRTFHLTSQGEDVAIYVAGEADGRFDPGDSITFYGQKFRGDTLAALYADEMADWLTLCPACELAGMFEKYTDENVYWLTAGGEPGPRMASIDGTPTDTAPVPDYYRATVHAEQSHEWYTHHFTSEDTWFWERVQTGFDPITRTYTTTLTALANGDFTATVRGEVVARNTGDHDTRFLLNNRSDPLDWSTWVGKTNHTFEVQVNQSDLHEGENELHFVSDGDLDWVYFNWFEIEYVRRFEAEDDQLL
ncbi:MAG: C25 family peptidase propeptide domain-containing protein, partial [Anaerolineae bacterium]